MVFGNVAYFLQMGLKAALETPVDLAVLKTLKTKVQDFISQATRLLDWRVLNPNQVCASYVLVDARPLLMQSQCASLDEYCRHMKKVARVDALPMREKAMPLVRFCIRTDTDVTSVIARLMTWQKKTMKKQAVLLSPMPVLRSML